MNKSITALFLIFIAFASCKEPAPKPVNAVFTYKSTFCEHKGTYSTKKYSRGQIEDTYKLWFTSPTFELLAKSRIHNTPVDYFIKDEDSLDKQYADKKIFYKNLKFVDTPFWNSVLQDHVYELDLVYHLLKAEAQGYKNPQSLLNNRYTYHCREYAEALASQDTLILLAAWKKLAKEQVKTNTDPKRFWEKYNEMYNAKDRLIYARIQVTTYGWYNCANREFNHITFDEEGYLKEFDSLFIKTTSQCDDLD
jgi:hypothetical protein